MTALTPTRIQRRRTRGWRMPEGAVYVGRPGRWGNGDGAQSTDGVEFLVGIPQDVTLTSALSEQCELSPWEREA